MPTAPSINARFGRMPARIGALAFLAASFAVGVWSRGGEGARFAAIPLLHVETVEPPCSPARTTRANLTIVTAYLPPAKAGEVASVEVSGDGENLVAARREGVCEWPGGGEPCRAEACADGVCALRIPAPLRLSGEGVVVLRDAGGGLVARGAIAVGPGEPPPPPPLEAGRGDGGVEVRGQPWGVARVSVVRDGRVAGDAPLRLDGEGRGAFRPPPGTEAVKVSAARSGPGGAVQASAVLPAPFEPGCPGPALRP